MNNKALEISQKIAEKWRQDEGTKQGDVRALAARIEEILIPIFERDEDLTAKLQYLLSNFIISEEGLFTFPDGDTWNCKPNEPHS